MAKSNKEWQPSIVSPTDMGFFLNEKADFAFIQTHLHQSFQVNKIEEARQYINFPLPPHRKTVFEFIFLTAGTTSRAKSIDAYNIAANDFFFLPAYQSKDNTSLSPSKINGTKTQL